MSVAIIRKGTAAQRKNVRNVVTYIEKQDKDPKQFSGFRTDDAKLKLHWKLLGKMIRKTHNEMLEEAVRDYLEKHSDKMDQVLEIMKVVKNEC